MIDPGAVINVAALTPEGRALLVEIMRTRASKIKEEIAALRDEAERVAAWLAEHDTPTGQ